MNLTPLYREGCGGARPSLFAKTCSNLKLRPILENVTLVHPLSVFNTSVRHHYQL